MYIFLEGLPGVGKTTIINNIKNKNIKKIKIIEEIINKNILNNKKVEQCEYIKNDNLKIFNSDNEINVIDRGPISTLSYNQLKSILDTSFKKDEVEKWFNNIKSIYKNSKIIFLDNEFDYYIPYEDALDPYGTIENQKKLKQLTIENCYKYCEKVSLIKYNKNNMEDVVNEIIN